MSSSDLMRVFDCTEDDLEANRAGHLTERQAKRLTATMNKGLLLTAIPMFGLLIICWFIAFNLITVAPSRYNKILILALFGLLPTLFWICYFAYEKYRLQSDVKIGKTETIEGNVRSWETRSFTYVKVAEKYLNLGAFVNSDLEIYLRDKPKQIQFRVYFVPKSKRVVAMELITHDPPPHLH